MFTPQLNRVKRLAAGLPKRYEFLSLIGRGSASYVLLADDLEFQTRVAVKILRPELATLVGEQRFRREIEILKQLAHPNIPPFLDSGPMDNGSLFLVTTFIDGETLRSRLLREKKLTENETVRTAGEVAAALDYAHERGLIHRDIKPANILLAGEHVFVADFGISRPIITERFAPITLAGMALGTPEYMSPEQITGEGELYARTDVYAMWCVAYEMLTGKPPFSGGMVTVFVDHRTKTAKPIREVRPEISAGVAEAVAKSLAKQRESRFATAGDFARALTAGNVSAR